jgi:hypothetical protein
MNGAGEFPRCHFLGRGSLCLTWNGGSLNLQGGRYEIGFSVGAEKVALSVVEEGSYDPFTGDRHVVRGKATEKNEVNNNDIHPHGCLNSFHIPGREAVQISAEFGGLIR